MILYRIPEEITVRYGGFREHEMFWQFLGINH